MKRGCLILLLFPLFCCGGLWFWAIIPPTQVRAFQALRPGTTMRELAEAFPYKVYLDDLTFSSLPDARKFLKDHPAEVKRFNGRLWLKQKTEIDGSKETVLEVEDGIITHAHSPSWQVKYPALKLKTPLKDAISQLPSHIALGLEDTPIRAYGEVTDLPRKPTYLDGYTGELYSVTSGIWFQYDMYIEMVNGRIVSTKSDRSPAIFR